MKKEFPLSISFDMAVQVGLALLAVPVGAFLLSGLGCHIIHHQTIQVLAMTLASIIAVAVAAAFLICIPDFLHGSNKPRRRERGRTRCRSSRRSKASSQSQQSSKEGCNHSEHQIHSTDCLATSSRGKTPSMPPLPIDPRSARLVNSKSTTGLHQVSSKQTHRTLPARRYSSPPCLPLQDSNSQHSLNPIAERKLEDLSDYDEFYWRELDSRTQYYALILGYTPATWDDDFDLDDLICEDWDWDEMTKEQKAAAQHFGYTEETWSDC